MSADGSGNDGGTKQRFELYIKASAIDKETKGSCPICQHWFMITCLLGENQDDIDFKVYTVQADCPPKNFGVEQGWSKKFPVVMVLEGRDKKGQDLTGTKYDTFEELETFFESINRECPELKRKNAPNVAAMQAVEDVYNAFNTSLNTGKPNKRLESSLKKINEFLSSDDDSKYLVDNVLSFADCYLLPRLQHIRVAGKEYLDNYDIPKELTAIWKYLADAYQTEAFRSTMPSDQDIVFHYEKKAAVAVQNRKRRPRPTLQNFTYTLDIPEDVALMLKASGASTNGDVSEPSAPADEVPAVDISPQQQQEEEVLVVSQQEEVVSAEANEAVADDGISQDVPVVPVEEAAVEALAISEEAEEVKADEVNVTPAPPVVDDADVQETTATEQSQIPESCGPEEASVAVDSGGGDDDVTVTAVSTDSADGVSEGVTQVNNNAADDDAGGVNIVVGQEEEEADVKVMGNGDVIGQKENVTAEDNVVIIKTDDGVISAD